MGARPAERQALVLIIEDSPGIVRLLELSLRHAGFAVASAHNADDGLRIARKQRPDVVLLDILLPDASGLDLLDRLRASGDPAVVMITASDRPLHRRVALDRGASDYLVKPFSPQEVVERVRATLSRRARGLVPPAVIRAGRLEIDLERRTASRDGAPVELSGTEWRIIDCLAAHAGRPVPASALLASVWGADHAGDHAYLRVWMERLQRNLATEGDAPAIRRVPGLGYALEAHVPPAVAGQVEC